MQIILGAKILIKPIIEKDMFGQDSSESIKKGEIIAIGKGTFDEDIIVEVGDIVTYNHGQSYGEYQIMNYDSLIEKL